MTVKQLIELLEMFPPETFVYTDGYSVIGVEEILRWEKPHSNCVRRIELTNER